MQDKLVNYAEAVDWQEIGSHFFIKHDCRIASTTVEWVKLEITIDYKETGQTCRRTLHGSCCRKNAQQPGKCVQLMRKSLATITSQKRNIEKLLLFRKLHLL